MILKIGICDDEINYANIISDYIKTFEMASDNDFSYKADIFSSPTKFLSTYTKPGTYDIIFLDVEMPECNGIELAEKIRNIGDKNVRIVFVSNYPEYMQDSFSVQAFYYLSKPLSYNSFKSIILKIIKSIEESTVQKSILPLNSQSKLLVNTSDIIYIEAVKSKKNLLHFVLKNEEVNTLGTILEWSEKLDDKIFLMPFRGTLVNVNHIHIIEKNKLIMTNGAEIPLSRHYEKEIRSIFSKRTLTLHL